MHGWTSNSGQLLQMELNWNTNFCAKCDQKLLNNEKKSEKVLFITWKQSHACLIDISSQHSSAYCVSAAYCQCVKMLFLGT